MNTAALLQKIKPYRKPLPEGMAFKNASVLIATWFGAGLVRPAPGTMGSLAAIPPGFIIAHFFGMTGLGIAALILFILGCFAADIYGKKSGKKDDQSIVVDEVVGLWIAALPAEGHWSLWLSAFVLFRLFDIYKPWPASYFDKRGRGGFGVMMDDVIAGLFAFVGVASFALSISF